MEELDWEIECECGNKTDFQTSFNEFDAYSEYTVLSNSEFTIKCIKCGAFADLGNEFSNNNWNYGSYPAFHHTPKGHNKVESFVITCPSCNAKNDYEIIDDFEEKWGSFLTCKKCKFEKKLKDAKNGRSNNI